MLKNTLENLNKLKIKKVEILTVKSFLTKIVLLICFLFIIIFNILFENSFIMVKFKKFVDASKFAVISGDDAEDFFN